MKPVVGVVGPTPDLPDLDLVEYRPGLSVDAVLVMPGEFPPEGVPEWMPIVDEPNAKAIRKAIGRWSIAIEETQVIHGPGTVVFGTLANGRLRQGENVVREGPRTLDPHP